MAEVEIRKDKSGNTSAAFSLVSFFKEKRRKNE
jgi:hypothetical protein